MNEKLYVLQQKMFLRLEEIANEKNRDHQILQPENQRLKILHYPSQKTIT